LFKTLETVAVETPAALATSRMVRAMMGNGSLGVMEESNGLKYRRKKNA
jgi:hypothetical protein